VNQLCQPVWDGWTKQSLGKLGDGVFRFVSPVLHLEPDPILGDPKVEVCFCATWKVP
jgi:hypothetical protein